MNLAFDHLVHFIRREPKEAAAIMSSHGFHAVAGGRHEAWGTHNALSYLDLSYLEFLAVEDEARAAHSDNSLVRQLTADLAHGEGMGQVALRTNDIEGVARRLTARGLAVSGPHPGSRRREDGSLLTWQMMFVEHGADVPHLPFFIQWGESDEERRRDLAARGVMARHPAGELRLAYVAWAVRDLDQAVSRWREWFGLEAGEPGVDASLNARCQELYLPGGNIRLCSPLGDGPVQEVLDKRGERPFLAAVSGASAHRELRVLGSVYRLLP